MIRAAVHSAQSQERLGTTAHSAQYYIVQLSTQQQHSQAVLGVGLMITVRFTNLFVIAQYPWLSLCREAKRLVYCAAQFKAQLKKHVRRKLAVNVDEAQ